MATVNVLKKTPQHAVVSILGTGSGTVSLNDLATSYEIVDRPNVKVNINTAMFSVTGTTTISRNGTNVLVLTDGQETFKFSAEVGFSIDTENNANIVVNKGAADGTVILGLSKVAGYVPNVLTSIGYDITQPTSLRS